MGELIFVTVVGIIIGMCLGVKIANYAWTTQPGNIMTCSRGTYIVKKVLDY